jgi:hypothetical protein
MLQEHQEGVGELQQVFLTTTNIDKNMRVDIFENFASYPANKFSCIEAASEHIKSKTNPKKRCKPFN